MEIDDYPNLKASGDDATSLGFTHRITFEKSQNFIITVRDSSGCLSLSFFPIN